jgi:hypothetical protein
MCELELSASAIPSMMGMHLGSDSYGYGLHHYCLLKTMIYGLCLETFCIYELVLIHLSGYEVYVLCN